MHHIQLFTCAKDPSAPDTNEDRIVVIPGRLFAVIDGATDLGGIRYDDWLGQNASGGRLAAEAVAEALCTVGAGGFDALPDPRDLVATMNGAIGAIYARLGLGGRHRFRAGVSAALISGSTVRLLAVGDCTIRINGEVVLAHAFPGDTVLAKARSVAFMILTQRGMDIDSIRALARQAIVQGPTSEPLPEPFRPEDAQTIRDAVMADPAVRQACGNDAALIDALLRTGLQGVRNDPEAFDAVTFDGVGDPSRALRSIDLPLEGVETLELASDGYPAMPAGVGIAEWEDVLSIADEVDPERIGIHCSTKGRTAETFADDRSVLVAKRAFAP